jgi:hypothetical protein
MAADPVAPLPPALAELPGLTRIACFPRLRALTWDGHDLYASRGYKLLRADMRINNCQFQEVAGYRPAWWRNITAGSRLAGRLFRDGFHALAILSSRHMVATVPGAILTRPPGDAEFHISHKVHRGTRPLHITITPDDRIFWGEYFDNPQKGEVHIYSSSDRGSTWAVAYTFPRRAVRHVHNVVYDRWANCLWVLTGDHGAECRILRASCDFRSVELVASASQQTRAVALIPTPDGLFFSSDTPLERNFVYHLDRQDRLTQLANLSSSSLHGCRVGEAMFFSTMVEPSAVNLDRNARLYGSLNGSNWRSLISWEKDGWPMKWFQFGNIFLPDGNNTSNLLALSTVALRDADCETSIWSLNPS